jgi:hypothetical protein
MNSVESLADVVADLLALEEGAPFLRRLFQLQPGTWAAVPLLCADLPATALRIEELAKLESGGTVYATWLEYPMSGYGPGYCTIIFFLEDAHWSTLALYNKSRFTRRADDMTSPGPDHD